MECAVHPGSAAVGSCVGCGKPGCDQCLEQVAGHPMCRPCVSAAQARIGAPDASMSPAGTGATASAGPAPPSITPAAVAPSMPAPYPENPPAQPVEIQGEPAEGFHYLKAFAYGLGAALVGAFLWAKLSQVLPFGIGFVAIFLGMGVAIAVKVGAENRSGPLLPVIGVLLCGLSVLLGNVMMDYEIASRDPSAASLPVFVRLPVVIWWTLTNMTPFQWVWVAIAMWEGWSIPRQKIVVQGVKDQLLQNLPERLEFGQAYPDQFPQLDRQTLQQGTEQLQELGFEWASDYRPSNAPAAWPPGMARLFLHREERCYAEIAQAFPAGQPPIGPWVAMASELDQGWQLSTSNLALYDPGTYVMRRPRTLWSRHPGTPIAELFRIHLDRRGQMSNDLGIEPLPVSTEAHWEHENRNNADRRAVLSAMTDAQILLEHREAQRQEHTEWWGDWEAPAARV